MENESKVVFYLIGFGFNGYPRLKKTFDTEDEAGKYIFSLKRQICRSPMYEEKMLTSPNFFLNETAAAFHMLRLDIGKFPKLKSIIKEQEPLYAVTKEQEQGSDSKEHKNGNECEQAQKTSCSNRAQCC